MLTLRYETVAGYTEYAQLVPNKFLLKPWFYAQVRMCITTLALSVPRASASWRLATSIASLTASCSVNKMRGQRNNSKYSRWNIIREKHMITITTKILQVQKILTKQIYVLAMRRQVTAKPESHPKLRLRDFEQSLSFPSMPRECRKPDSLIVSFPNLNNFNF